MNKTDPFYKENKIPLGRKRTKGAVYSEIKINYRNTSKFYTIIGYINNKMLTIIYPYMNWPSLKNLRTE